MRRPWVRRVWLLNLLAGIGLAIWISGTNDAPWIRMLLSGLALGVAIVSAMELVIIILIRDPPWEGPR